MWELADRVEAEAGGAGVCGEAGVSCGVYAGGVVVSGSGEVGV